MFLSLRLAGLSGEPTLPSLCRTLRLKPERIDDNTATLSQKVKIRTESPCLVRYSRNFSI